MGKRPPLGRHNMGVGRLPAWVVSCGFHADWVGTDSAFVHIAFVDLTDNISDGMCRLLWSLSRSRGA